MAGTGVLPWSILTINLNLLVFGVNQPAQAYAIVAVLLHLDLRFFETIISDINSTTKSGARAGTYLDLVSIKSIHLSCLTHAASGERSAPFGSLKPVEESKAIPVLISPVCQTLR